MINITRVQITPESFTAIAANLAALFGAEATAPNPTAQTTHPPAASHKPIKLAATGVAAAAGATDHAAVIDPATGLMWAAQTSDDRINWEAADKAAKACSLLGYTDWRLPTIKELLEPNTTKVKI